MSVRSDWSEPWRGPFYERNSLSVTDGDADSSDVSSAIVMTSVM